MRETNINDVNVFSVCPECRHIVFDIRNKGYVSVDKSVVLNDLYSVSLYLSPAEIWEKIKKGEVVNGKYEHAFSIPANTKLPENTCGFSSVSEIEENHRREKKYNDKREEVCEKITNDLTEVFSGYPVCVQKPLIPFELSSIPSYKDFNILIRSIRYKNELKAFSIKTYNLNTHKCPYCNCEKELIPVVISGKEIYENHGIDLEAIEKNYAFAEIVEMQAKDQFDEILNKIILYLPDYKNEMDGSKYDIDKVDIKEYLRLLISVKDNIMFIERELLGLIKKKVEISIMLKYRQIESSITENDIEEYWKRQIEEIDNKIQCVKDNIGENKGITPPEMVQQREEPIEPRKPVKAEKYVMSKKKPDLPMYEKVGFLNKKKAIEKNKLIEQCYQENLRKYQEEEERATIIDAQNEKQYQDEMKEYEAMLKEYNDNLKEYNDCIEKQKEYMLKMEEFRKMTSQVADDCMLEYRSNGTSDVLDFLLEIIELQEERSDLYDKKLDGSLVYDLLIKHPDCANLVGGYSFLSDEIKKRIPELNNQYRLLNRLLSLNLVYAKYNDIIAWTTIYEYLDSGRCSELQGINGAYNLYENETRTEIIISQLDTVISQLDQIKKNQYMLYNILDDINTGVIDLNDKLDNVIKNIEYISRDCYEVSKLVRKIEATSEAIEYNTAVAAKYSVITANTAKTGLFLKAIYG